jgi:hypothetical protein
MRHARTLVQSPAITHRLFVLDERQFEQAALLVQCCLHRLLVLKNLCLHRNNRYLIVYAAAPSQLRSLGAVKDARRIF